MSVFLTPELKPFFGGTYFPPEDKYGRPGFPTVLQRLAEAWEKDREKVTTAAATNTLEYVPVMMPTIIVNAKPFSTSPPTLISADLSFFPAEASPARQSRCTA